MLTSSPGFFHFVLLTNLVYSALARLPPPDATNINYIIETSTCSSTNNDFIILFLVISHPGNINNRMLARSTYPSSEINAIGMRRIFLLGSEIDAHNTEYKNISKAQIRAESDRFSDIIVLNLTESYYSLTVKCLAGFTWATSRCKQTRFIAKIDDDVFVEYYSLRKYIDKIPRGEDDAFIRGKFCSVKRPIRNKKAKNFLSFSDYPSDRLPKFLQGPFYFMSTATMRRLVAASKTVPAISAEDVYFTGLVADAVGVRRTEIPILPERFANSTQCCLEHSVVNGVQGRVFECKAIAIEQHVNFDASHGRRIKQHGRFCYSFHCQPYSTLRAPASPRVDCF